MKLIFNIIIFFSAIALINAAGGGATDIIKTLNSKISGVKSKEKIAKELEEYSCFSCISSDVLDKYCKNLSDKQCADIKDVFAEMVKYSIADKLSGFSSYSISYLGEETNDGLTTVKTNVKSGEKSYSINYEMKQISGKWKIVNYIVEDISTSKNYKKQFRKLFKKQSYDQIISRLKSKLKELKK